MFHLLLPLGMKGVKIKTNWYISLKYLCISYNNRDTFFHAAMILTHALKLAKLLLVKIITKHTTLKNQTIQAPMKMYGFKNILF